MLHGKSAQAVAIANTAILMQLIGKLVEQGTFTKPNAIALLGNAADALERAPNATSQRVGKAIEIIRRDLMPQMSNSRIDPKI